MALYFYANLDYDVPVNTFQIIRSDEKLMGTEDNLNDAVREARRRFRVTGLKHTVREMVTNVGLFTVFSTEGRKPTQAEVAASRT